MATESQTNYPLLESMLEIRGLQLQATYSTSDVAKLFGTSSRTILYRIDDGSLPSRKLIGKARFLPCDLETFLCNSLERKTDGVR